jgi:uncharacterized membrane protein
VAAYAIVLLGCAVAYWILVGALLAVHEPGSPLHRAIGNDFKGKLSVLMYVVSIGIAFLVPWLSVGLFVAVALMWFVPDRRVTRTLQTPA